MKKVNWYLSALVLSAFSAGSAYAKLELSSYAVDYLADDGNQVPLGYEVSYNYQGDTFVQISGENGEVGAYYCDGDQIVFAELEKRSGGQYVAKGIYKNVYLYRKNASRGLFSGALRLKYDLTADTSVFKGQQECVELISNRIDSAVSDGGSSIDYVGVKSHNDMHGLGDFSEIKSTFEYALSGAVVYPEAVQGKKSFSHVFNIPFGPGQLDLISSSRAVMDSSVVPLSQDAAQIKIFVSPDTAEMRNLQGKLDANGAVMTDTEMGASRYISLVSHLVMAGVDPSVIEYTNDVDDNSVFDDNEYSADAIVSIIPKSAVENVVVGKAVIQSNGGDALALAGSKPSLAAMQSDVNVAPNVFAAHKGQLLSDALESFFARNDYTLLWDVKKGVDWQFDDDVQISDGNFVDTLTVLLKRFPVQAVLSNNDSKFARIRMRHSDSRNEASNIVPIKQ